MSDQQKRSGDPAGQQPANPFESFTPPKQPMNALLGRLECLLDAYWLSAVSGDVKSAELVRRLLQQQADVYGGKAVAVSDDGDDELAKLRARRAAGA